MSYSLNMKCFQCKKSWKCVDPQVLGGAIFTIHSIGFEKGHLGGGSIDLNCQNFEPKEPEVPKLTGGGE